jgi:pimeloyl-ACP methyl ester carboxylesterase
MPVPRTTETVVTSFHKPIQEWVDSNNASREQAGVWVKKTMEALNWFDIVSRLPKIKASASLIVYGEHDPLRELAEDILRYNLPNAEKAILKDLAHVPQVEGPEAFLDAVLPFLKEGVGRS